MIRPTRQQLVDLAADTPRAVSADDTRAGALPDMRVQDFAAYTLALYDAIADMTDVDALLDARRRLLEAPSI